MKIICWARCSCHRYFFFVKCECCASRLSSHCHDANQMLSIFHRLCWWLFIWLTDIFSRYEIYPTDTWYTSSSGLISFASELWFIRAKKCVFNFVAIRRVTKLILPTEFVRKPYSICCKFSLACASVGSGKNNKFHLFGFSILLSNFWP